MGDKVLKTRVRRLNALYADRILNLLENIFYSESFL